MANKRHRKKNRARNRWLCVESTFCRLHWEISYSCVLICLWLALFDGRVKRPKYMSFCCCCCWCCFCFGCVSMEDEDSGGGGDVENREQNKEEILTWIFQWSSARVRQCPEKLVSITKFKNYNNKHYRQSGRERERGRKKNATKNSHHNNNHNECPLNFDSIYEMCTRINEIARMREWASARNIKRK